MNIFNAAMLRSGSTHIEHGLAYMLGWRNANLVNIHGEGQGEQNLNPFSVAILATYDKQVFGGHHSAYVDTLAALQYHGMKPMVCTRNLYDTIVSCKERIDMNGGHGSVLPPTYIPREWNDWDDHTKYIWLAYNAGHWQIKFFVSWLEADREKHWIKYNDFYSDQRTGFKKILDYYGLPYPAEDYFDVVSSWKAINFNKGIMGRGKGLPDDVKAILDAEARAWGRTNEPFIWKMLYD